MTEELNRGICKCTQEDLGMPAMLARGLECFHDMKEHHMQDRSGPDVTQRNMLPLGLYHNQQSTLTKT